MHVFKVLKELKISYFDKNYKASYFTLSPNDYFFINQNLVYKKNMLNMYEATIMLEHFYYLEEDNFKWIKNINIIDPYIKIELDTKTYYSKSYLYDLKNDINQLKSDQIIEDYTTIWYRDKKINDLFQ